MKEHKYNLQTMICKRCGASVEMAYKGLECVSPAEYLWGRVCGMGAVLAYLAMYGVEQVKRKLRRKFK